MDRLKFLILITIGYFFMNVLPAFSVGIFNDDELSGEVGLRLKIEDEEGESNSDLQFSTSLDYSFEFSNSLEAFIGLRTSTYARPTRGWVNTDLIFDETTFYFMPWGLTHSGSIHNCDIETTIGTIEYPFGGSGLVFDNDFYRPAIQQEYNFNLKGPDLDVGWVAMYLQPGDLHGDAWLFAVNTEFEIFSDDSRTTSAQISYIDYINEDSISQALNEDRLIVSGHVPDQFTTNNTITKFGEFPSDYGIFILRLEQDWDGQIPVTGWYEYVNNVCADTSDGARNEAYSIGLEFGDADDAGDWEIGGRWLVIEDDAVLELYNKGKYGTNVRGWTTSITYMLADDVEIFADGYWLRTNAFRDGVDTFNSRIFQFGIKFEF